MSVRGQNCPLNAPHGVAADWELIMTTANANATKREQTFTFTADTVAMAVTIKERATNKEHVLEWAKLPPEIQKRCGLHGLQTVLQQRNSGIKAGAEKLTAMLSLFEGWAGGAAWEAERSEVNTIPAWLVPAIMKATKATAAVALASAQAAAKQADKAAWAALLEKYKKYKIEADAGQTIAL